MNDQQLLELAAKAAGLEYHWVKVDGGSLMQASEPGSRNEESWNPLADDGDALRLAIRLRLWLHVEEYGASARRAGGAWIGCEARLHGGIKAATRRAIVRAAAAIGKEL
ncbi:hypothetical protein ACOTF2_18180 [Achromobacter xylosoxidans]